MRTGLLTSDRVQSLLSHLPVQSSELLLPRGSLVSAVRLHLCSIYRLSSQCQRESWYVGSLCLNRLADPRSRAYHKQECSREEGKGLTYFTQKIFNNPLIRHYLELALIYEFELHKATPSELKGLPLVPFDAFMDLIIEPRDLQQRAALLDQKGSWNHAGVEGVVLINALFDSTARLSPQLYSQEVLHMMRTALPGSHLVVLGIRHRSHRISTNIIGLRPQMIEIARKGSFGFKRITMPLHALSGPSVPLQGLINPRYTDQPGTPGMDGDVCNMVK